MQDESRSHFCPFSNMQTCIYHSDNKNHQMKPDDTQDSTNEQIHRKANRGRYSRVDQTNKQTLIYLVTKEGHSIKEASVELGINYSTAKSIIQVHRLQEESWYNQDDDYQPLPRGRPRKVTPEIIHSIDICRQVNPTISLQGIHDYIMARHNLRLCKATIHNYLREIKNSQSLSNFDQQNTNTVLFK